MVSFLLAYLSNQSVGLSINYKQREQNTILQIKQYSISKINKINQSGSKITDSQKGSQYINQLKLQQKQEMSRSQPYRGKMPVEILKTLDVASRITLFLVGQSGPLCFTFKDRLNNKYKTSIGAQLKCTCSPNKNDHCIHTLYVMLKIFRISPQNPIIWQAAYVDSELTDLLAGKHSLQTNRRMIRPVFQQHEQNFMSDLPSDFIDKKRRGRTYSLPQGKAERMKLNEDSVCPICQEPMTEDECLSYCRIKCGNNFHLECLKVWAEHKSTSETAITCPMCRTPFGDNYLDQIHYEQKQHKKIVANKIKIKFKCSGCGVDQIPKNVHKCLLCSSYELCQICYKSNKHIKHPFIRQLEEDPTRWCGASQRREQQLKMKKYIDNKRKQKNVNEQLIEKLRKIEEDPTKLLDFVASSYPYVSKYISDNVDPYKKMDLNPDDMKCQKCFSKKMLFLRRITCGHFIDHECMKQNIRKERFYCEQCGGKIVKGYQNLIAKQKQLQNDKEKKMMEVSSQFNPSPMQKKEDYNFILPDQATLADILGGRIRESYHEPDQSRLRQRLASNLVRGSEALNAFRNRQGQIVEQRPRNQSNTIYRTRQQIQGTTRNNNVRIRNVVPKPPGEQHPQTHQSQHRSVSRNGARKQGNKKSRQDMATMLEAMIGRKIF